MVCTAALRVTREHLLHDTPAALAKKINWWTPETIKEALDELVVLGLADRLFDGTYRLRVDKEARSVDIRESDS